MAVKTAGRPRKPRAKQGRLPGMEPDSIRELDDAAENYFDVVRDRCKLSKEEDEKKDNLIALMNQHKIARYENEEGLVVTLTEKQKVKVEKKKQEPDGESEE